MKTCVRAATSSPALRSTTRRRKTGEQSPVVLVVASESRLRRQLVAAMKHAGYQVREASSEVELRRCLDPRVDPRERPALMVVAVTAEESEALAVLGDVYRSRGLPPCVVLVPQGRADLRARAFANGASTVVENPHALRILPAIAAEEVPLDLAVGC
jgi:DNA-binding response OmpR family regulator